MTSLIVPIEFPEAEPTRAPKLLSSSTEERRAAKHGSGKHPSHRLTSTMSPARARMDFKTSKKKRNTAGAPSGLGKSRYA
jgi:hypothetical protein